MKNILIKTIIIIIIIFLSFSLISCAKEEITEEEVEQNLSSEKIILASGEWSPYVSEELKYGGVVSRIVTEAFALQDIEADYVYLPWKRSMEGAKNGKWHGTLPWLKNEERQKYFYFSEPIAYEEIVFFYKKDMGFNWKTVSDLKNYKIGGTIGYYYGEEFASAEENGKILIDRSVNDEENFEKLAAGRLDIVIAEISVGYELIRKQVSQDEFTHHPKPIKPKEELYLILSKAVEGNENLIEQFNEGLRSLQESGKVDLYWKESRRGDYKKESAA